MTDDGKRGGRPALSSADVIAEAAAELFLECGYEQVSADMIAQRVGLSRSSYFNYVSAKSDSLWLGVDRAIDAAETVGATSEAQCLAALIEALERSGAPAGLVHANAMVATDAIAESRPPRIQRIARLLRGVRGSATEDAFEAAQSQIHADADATAIVAAVVAWAQAGPARRSLREYVTAALAPRSR